MKRTLSILVVFTVCHPALAQFVVPGSYENVPGTGTFLGPLSNAQRTYQLLIHESLLTDMVGLQLTGLTWRSLASATSDWPTADVTFNNYDIYLSGSVTPANRSLTFANNIVGPQTQVRSGPLNIPTGSYTSGDSPNAFGPTIGFSNYAYNGGHLLIEIRHTGFSGTSRSVDALLTSTSGYGTLFSGAWTGNYTGTSGAQGNFSIVQLSAVPEPTTMALLGLGLLTALRRRR